MTRGGRKKPALMPLRLVHQLTVTLRNIEGDLRHHGKGVLKGGWFHVLEDALGACAQHDQRLLLP